MAKSGLLRHAWLTRPNQLWASGSLEAADIWWEKLLFGVAASGTISASGSPVFGGYTASGTVVNIFELSGTPVFAGYTADGDVLNIFELSGTPVFAGYTADGDVLNIFEVTGAPVFAGYISADGAIETILEVAAAAIFGGYFASGTVEVEGGEPPAPEAGVGGGRWLTRRVDALRRARERREPRQGEPEPERPRPPLHEWLPPPIEELMKDAPSSRLVRGTPVYRGWVVRGVVRVEEEEDELVAILLEVGWL